MRIMCLCMFVYISHTHLHIYNVSPRLTHHGELLLQALVGIIDQQLLEGVALLILCICVSSLRYGPLVTPDITNVGLFPCV